jgi:hypothetical protein
MSDLFTVSEEYQVNQKAMILAEEMFQKMLANPVQLQERLFQQLEVNKKLVAINNENLPKVERYNAFLNADGYLSSDNLKGILKLKYIDPKGKVHDMGKQYIPQILCKDGWIKKTHTGYLLTYRGKERFKNEADDIIATKECGNKTSVKFTGKGAEMVYEIYKNDARIWHSNSEKELYCE